MRLRRAGYLDKFSLCQSIKHEGVARLTCNGSLSNLGKAASEPSPKAHTISRCPFCRETVTANSPRVGSFCISRTHDYLRAYLKGVTLDFSRPGKPTDNAFIESFNGKCRTECLKANWFLSLDEARAKCEAWRRDYNEVRPHSAIGNRTPIELHRIVASPASRTSEEAGIF